MSYTLPAESRKLNLNDNVRVNTSVDFIFFFGPFSSMTVKERKIFYIAAAQCKKNDRNFFYYETTALELSNYLGVDVKSMYNTLDKITDSLASKILRDDIRDVKNQKFLKRGYKVFETCIYDNGRVGFELSKDIEPFILNLKNSSKPLLLDFSRMKSSYSITIWHYLQFLCKSRKPDIPEKFEIKISLKTLRAITGTQDKYELIYDFKKRVLDVAIKDIINCCGVFARYEEIKSGRNINGFLISIQNKESVTRENDSEFIVFNYSDNLAS